MTAREYAAECGIELVGKLTKKVAVSEEFNWDKCEMVVQKHVYWIDEAGNELGKCKYGGWYLVTADGGVW